VPTDEVIGPMQLPATRSLTLHDMAHYAVPGLFKIAIQGHEPLPKDGPMLLLANRCSLLDPWLLGLAAGRPVHLGATSPFFWLPGIGDLARRLGTVPLTPALTAAHDEASQFASALEKGHAVAVFADHWLEPRPEGPRYTVSPAFLEVLLATRSDRIPVVPLLCQGQGWQLQLQRNPLLSRMIHAGTRVFDPAHPPVLYTQNTLRVGRPVYWRDGSSEMTLQGFRHSVEDSLGALF
jgi:1-acyl-sn-glycerol-3-phosphate acyltransferase